MKPSEILQEIKSALNLNRAQIIYIYELENYFISKDRLDAILKNSAKKGTSKATYEELGIFLDGLIQYKRGTSKQKIIEEVILDNNLILKKLRVALNLKEYELVLIFELADFKINKSTIKDMFRSHKHSKLKECDNKTLKAFLIGLNEFYYENKEYI